MHLALVMLEQLAEDLRCGDELRRREFLASDHQDMMIGERAVQRSMGLAIDALVEVEAANLGAGVLGHRGDRVFHRLVPLRGRACAKYGGGARRFAMPWPGRIVAVEGVR